MEKTSVSTSSAPEVIIEQAKGNLYIKGWDRSEVTITAAPEVIKLEEQDDVVRISCQSNCTVRVPHNASLQIDSAHGNVRVKLLHDQLNFGEIHGNVALRDIAEFRGEKIQGNLRARRVSGDLEATHIAGNAAVRGVSGNCTLEKVAGNVDLREVDGEVKSSLEGNARLRLNMLMGSKYQVEAGGNIHCRIPQEANVNLDLTSGSKHMRVKMPEASQTVQQENYVLTLGSGEVSMKLSAGENIYLSALETWEEGDGDEDYAPLPEDFGDQISEQIEAQMEIMNRQLNEQFERLSETIGKSGLSEEEMDRIMEQARKKSERASVRTQEKIRRAQAKMERKLEATRRRNELRAQAASRKGHRKGAWSVGVPTPPEPPSAPVSDDERMLVLRMLEQKKITPEEAEELLAAMEGQAG